MKKFPNLVALREEIGMTQQELADALGVGIVTLRDVEHGRRQPSLRVRRAVEQFIARRERQGQGPSPPPASPAPASPPELPLSLTLMCQSMRLMIAMLESDIPLPEKYAHAVEFCRVSHRFIEEFDVEKDKAPADARIGRQPTQSCCTMDTHEDNYADTIRENSFS
jgi:transcriptional regulator with XRE-family HTH domain